MPRSMRWSRRRAVSRRGKSFWDVGRPATLTRMDNDVGENRQGAAGGGNHMDRHGQNDWGSVRYDPRFDEYWVPAGNARQALFYCPWCGVKLPASQRDRWFDQLEAMGIDPWGNDLPNRYRDDTWRRKGSTEG